VHACCLLCSYPGAEFISKQPPIIQLKDFLTPEECDEFIAAGRPGLVASTGGVRARATPMVRERAYACAHASWADK
jgi:hypothetical protein